MTRLIDALRHHTSRLPIVKPRVDEHAGADESRGVQLHAIAADMQAHPGEPLSGEPQEAPVDHDQVAGAATRDEFDAIFGRLYAAADAAFERALVAFGITDADELHPLTALATGGRFDATAEYPVLVDVRELVAA